MPVGGSATWGKCQFEEVPVGGVKCLLIPAITKINILIRDILLLSISAHKSSFVVEFLYIFYIVKLTILYIIVTKRIERKSPTEMRRLTT